MVSKSLACFIFLIHFRFPDISQNHVLTRSLSTSPPPSPPCRQGHGLNPSGGPMTRDFRGSQLSQFTKPCCRDWLAAPQTEETPDRPCREVVRSKPPNACLRPNLVAV